MACRGVFFAITAAELNQLLNLVGDDDALSDAVNMLYSQAREEAGFQAGVDKAWDAMHRCLGDGMLDDIGSGLAPLSRFVLGGRNLYEGESYIICLLMPEQVKETCEAANVVTKESFRDRYFKLDPKQYDGPWEEEDFEYTWSYFDEARTVFNNASKAGRAVIFLTDQ